MSSVLKTNSTENNQQSKRDKQLQAKLKQTHQMPEHIAIIMDGNGRWAKSKGNLRVSGHKAGVESVRDITEACVQLGIQYLTLYTFSTENWQRPKTEIHALMQILVNSLQKESDMLNENNIKLAAIGQTNRFPKNCQNKLNEVIHLTRHNDGLVLCLALSYSGRWDITEAVKKVSRQVEKGFIDPADITDSMISQYLSTARIPDPDLIIRTSGEYRISNFLLWQLAYSELYITETYWPDFRREELYKAIFSYIKRDRRYGCVKTDKAEKEQTNLTRPFVNEPT
jgi:undecaprenyl diphosphate synthase